MEHEITRARPNHLSPEDEHEGAEPFSPNGSETVFGRNGCNARGESPFGATAIRSAHESANGERISSRNQSNAVLSR